MSMSIEGPANEVVPDRMTVDAIGKVGRLNSRLIGLHERISVKADTLVGVEPIAGVDTEPREDTRDGDMWLLLDRLDSLSRLLGYVEDSFTRFDTL